MATIKKKIEDLRPGKSYLVTARAKNPDLNSYSESVDSIVITIPGDSTIPDYPQNLQIVASFEKVMFIFSASEEKDISTYQYELYNVDQVSGSYPNEIIVGLPAVSGYSASNVFTVTVPENSYRIVSSKGIVTELTVSYTGRVRSIDTSGNMSPWSPFATPGDTTLIDDQYVNNLTASKLTAGTIGAHQIILAGSNSVISSSTYDGFWNGTQWTTGSTGWLISGNGQAIFDSSQIRGSISAGSININTHNYWTPSGSTAIFKVGSASQYMLFNGTSLSVTGSITSTSGSIGGFNLSADRLQAGSGSDQITIATGVYNVSTNPDELVIGAGGPLSSGFGLPFAVNSAGVVSANVATIGPLQLDSNGLTSQYYNSDNYISLNSSGDFYKNAKRGSYYYLSYILGELFQIKRVNSTGTPTGSGAFFGYYSAPDDVRLILNSVSSPSYTSGSYVDIRSNGTIVASSSITAGSIATSGSVSAGSVTSSGEISKSDTIRTRARINNDSLLFWNSSGVQKSEYSATGFYVDTGYVAGNFSVGGSKSFRIQHPIHKDKMLVHVSLEGPTSDVFYKGTSKLINGEIEIILPEYFEALTEENDRIVTLTPIVEEDNIINCNLVSTKIKNGKFKVYKTNNDYSYDQEFFWLVQATRKNAAFEVEPEKNEFDIKSEQLKNSSA